MFKYISIKVEFFLLSLTFGHIGSVLFLAAIFNLVLVFWTKMFFSFSQILIISICDSFSPIHLGQ